MTASGRCWRSACRSCSASTGIPSIADGTVPLTLELLSPAHRPIQTTRDLPGFWRGSWADVRADMRGRYPKHVWPEDPLSAPGHQPRQAARHIALGARRRPAHKPWHDQDHCSMPDFQQSHRLRLNTLIRLRWLAIVGQSVTVLVVAYWLEFPAAGQPVLRADRLFGLAEPVPHLPLSGRAPAAARSPALGILIFDSLQLAGLLYMTGGLTNPFSLLMTVPVVISATSLPLRLTARARRAGHGAGDACSSSSTCRCPGMTARALAMPFVYVAGMWMAVLSSISFTAIYAFRVAEEARLLANALAATELVLQREQHLSALDGLAAAAAHELGTPLATITLVAKEMERRSATTRNTART